MKQKHGRKWSTTARRKLSAALKRSWALRKKVTESIVYTPATAIPTPRKATIPQGVRDMDSIIQRADRMNLHGLMFLVGQLTQMLAIKSRPVE